MSKKSNQGATRKNNKKSDGEFPSKNIKHDPVSEGARAVFGLKNDPQDNSNITNKKLDNMK